MSNQPNETAESIPPGEQLELKLPDESSQLKDLGLWAGVLVLLVLVVYWPATNGKFLWRDNVAVSENQLLAVPGGMGSAWLGRWEAPDKYWLPTYQPMAFSAGWLEYRFGGHNEQGLPTPLAYHVANLIFHAGAAVLLWLILRELMLPGAWVAAAVFALHPLATESVSWISDQAWALGGLLFFGSIYTYLLYVKDREKDASNRATGQPGVDPAQMWGLYAASAVLFLLAILAHPATSPLPIVLILLLWWRNRLITRDYVLLGPLLMIAAGLWLSHGALNGNFSLSLFHLPAAVQLATAGAGFLSVWHFVAPVGLNALRPQWPAGLWWIGAVFIAVWAAILLLLWITKKRGLFTAAAIYVVLVLFSLNWFDLTRLADRTDAGSYLVIAPLAVLGTRAVLGLLRRFKSAGAFAPTAVVASAIVLIALGGLSWARVHVFDDSIAFWRDAIAKNPQVSFPEARLAEALRLQAVDEAAVGDSDSSKTDLAESLLHVARAVDLSHENAEAERTWANDLVATGEVKAALPHFSRANQINPDDFQTRIELGSALHAIGMYKESIPELDEALRLKPSSAMTHRLLGSAYAHLNQTERATAEEQQSLELDPADMVARQTLAELDAKTGKIKDAIQNYVFLLSDKTNQQRPELWVAVADLQDREGNFGPAVESYKAALELDPENADAKKGIEIDSEKAKKQAATQPTTQPTMQK